MKLCKIASSFFDELYGSIYCQWSRHGLKHRARDLSRPLALTMILFVLLSVYFTATLWIVCPFYFRWLIRGYGSFGILNQVFKNKFFSMGPDRLVGRSSKGQCPSWPIGFLFIHSVTLDHVTALQNCLTPWLCTEQFVFLLWNPLISIHISWFTITKACWYSFECISHANSNWSN